MVVHAHRPLQTGCAPWNQPHGIGMSARYSVVARYPFTAVAVLAAVLLASVAAVGWAHAASGASADPPQFLLPWADGQDWLTGISGFHTTKDAMDFFPPDTPLNLDVRYEGDPDWVAEESAYWVLASAAGTVTQAGDNQVVIDHGGGWSTGYYHMHDFIVAPGDQVSAEQPIAHPSTYGYCATGPHVHFWVQGPDGATTRNVDLSGRAATDIGINEHISDTGNTPADASPTPTPTVTPTDTPAPTETASPEPTGTPEPAGTPEPTDTPTPDATTSPTPASSPETNIVAGDVDCNGAIDALDALASLRQVGRTAAAACVSASGDVDCNGHVDGADALRILRYLAGLAPAPEPCLSKE